MDTTAVILAVASPPGRSARGIVRVSGRRAFDLLRPHLECGQWSRGAHCGRVRANGLDIACVVVVFPGPRSYTGEDALEIQLPGNPVLLERVVDALIDSARARGLEARRAEAGEFTARAFFNGRMTLTEAEGVAAVIAARCDAELRAARLLIGGRLGALARELADALADALALVEAGIDFTDQEDVVAIAPRDLGRRLSALRDRIDEQLRRCVGMEALRAIPWVVLAGEANAGKSTLFNTLLGHARAVVSEIAGTTRDVLAEPLSIDTAHGPAEVMLVDLAGAADDDSALNRRMQMAAREALDRAELVLRCVPADETGASSAAGEILLRTKCDRVVGGADVGGDHVGGGEEMAVSTRTGEGLDRLRRAIADRLAGRAVSLAADAMALRPRHEAALRSARENLDEALRLVEPSRRHLAEVELVAASMRLALDDLAALAGDVSPDDVLGRIFATFCVGK